MSRFSGPQHKGAMKVHREKKRQQAVERNAQTTEARRGYNAPHAKPEASNE